MVAAVELCRDFDAAGSRRLARKSKDGGQARRLLALAEIIACAETAVIAFQNPYPMNDDVKGSCCIGGR